MARSPLSTPRRCGYDPVRTCRARDPVAGRVPTPCRSRRHRIAGCAHGIHAAGGDMDAAARSSPLIAINDRTVCRGYPVAFRARASGAAAVADSRCCARSAKRSFVVSQDRPGSFRPRPVPSWQSIRSCGGSVRRHPARSNQPQRRFTPLRGPRPAGGRGAGAVRCRREPRRPDAPGIDG